MNMKFKLSGFTLAEVLITLGIIGVVAALTIPTLMQNADERANVVALKKAYTILSQAYKLAENENGTPDNWGMIGWSPSELTSKLKPYLKVDKDCSDGSQGCWPTGINYMYLPESWNSYGGYGVIDTLLYPTLKLVDGTIIGGYIEAPDCSTTYGDTPALGHVCARYLVDVNGYKKPNRIGKDVFEFWLTKFGIIPVGVQSQIYAKFEDDCLDKDSGSGESCAGWVITNDNMDYIHCNDLNWATKTKCN